MIEGQPRHFETPGAIVNRFAELVIFGLPIDHDARFRDRLEQIDLGSLSSAAGRHILPQGLVAVVVADASQVLGQLDGLGWAPVELDGG